MCDKPLLSNEEQEASRTSIEYFVQKFIEHRSRESNNHEFANFLNHSQRFKTHARIHIVESNKQVKTIFSDIEIKPIHKLPFPTSYDIDISNKEVQKVFGRAYINNNFYQMVLNNEYSTLEIYVNYLSKELKVIIFSDDKTYR